jgi:hypothetical protein
LPGETGGESRRPRIERNKLDVYRNAGTLGKGGLMELDDGSPE